MSRSTILVIGCAGYVGRELMLRLSREFPKKNIVGFDKRGMPRGYRRPRSDQYQALSRHPNNKGRMEELWAKGTVDLVVYLAQDGQQAPMEFASRMHRDNHAYFMQQVTRVVEHQCPNIVYASTYAMYAGVENGGHPIDETQYVSQVTNFYQAMMRFREDTMQAAFWTKGLASIGLRFFPIYGPRARETNLITKVIMEMNKGGGRICIPGRVEDLTDWVYVDDAVDLLTLACHRVFKYKDFHEIYNVSSGQGHSYGEVAEHLGHILARRVKFIPTNADPVYPSNIIGDNRKAERVFGWKPTTSLKSGLMHTVQLFDPVGLTEVTKQDTRAPWTWWAQKAEHLRAAHPVRAVR